MIPYWSRVKRWMAKGTCRNHLSARFYQYPWSNMLLKGDNQSMWEKRTVRLVESETLFSQGLYSDDRILKKWNPDHRDEKHMHWHLQPLTYLTVSVIPVIRAHFKCLNGSTLRSTTDRLSRNFTSFSLSPLATAIVTNRPWTPCSHLTVLVDVLCTYFSLAQTAAGPTTTAWKFPSCTCAIRVT